MGDIALAAPAGSGYAGGMPDAGSFEIFLAAPPGLEPMLLAEVAERGFCGARALPGGVIFAGGWPEVWRANLAVRGATRVLARIAEFRALHLAQLDKRARKLDWGAVLRADEPVKVEVTTRASRIWHAGAARSRIARAIAGTLGAPVPAEPPEDAVTVRVRIDDDLCTISVDTSGEPLHRRGHKQAVNVAPLRETLAALFLRAAGYAGGEPVLDPMCGSGTFVIEAAEIAAGLMPGRSRSFAFERLASFDRAAWAALRAAAPAHDPGLRFLGFDRDAGAIAMSRANAARAGVAALTGFAAAPIGALERPAGPPGLVIVNPPYGARLGDAASLRPLYAALGAVLGNGFGGWRAAVVTSEPALAQATGLPFGPPGPVVSHGGIKVRLWQTGRL